MEGIIKNPKICISYSWSTTEHQAWVLRLAERLRSNGVLVRLDIWDLKPGQDKFHYMEQMVKDDDISKVLVISDKHYQKKADERKGGVGTESQLISKEVYENVNQEKFIPIIKEKDEEGDPYLPKFMASRIYIDLSSKEIFEQEYNKLIKNIYGKPIVRRPLLGAIPAYIVEDKHDKDELEAGNQTFNDVPPDAWYFDYVEQLVNDTVIDPEENYRPNGTINRAELVKIAITAIDGLSGYEAPSTPTFDDVHRDNKYYDYIEAAVQLGIIYGYTDKVGNLTGIFGPEDIANRAWATKVLVNSFSVPTTLTPPSLFLDVTPGFQYHDYILTAYNQSIIDGPGDNTFHPTEPLTRALMAKWVVNAQSPVLRNICKL